MSPSRQNTFTKYPDPPAPNLHCPTCNLPLAYVDTVLGGVDHPERYDRFTCAIHGSLEYRHRTRTLRPVAGV